MIAQPSEAVTLLTRNSPPLAHKNAKVSGIPNSCRPLKRIKKNSEKPSFPKRSVSKGDRFSRAFRSALFHRSQYLGRPLLTDEWLRLAAATRKQISRAQRNSLVYELADLREQFKLFRDSLPSNPLIEASESMMMLQNQLQMLRRQVLISMEETDRLTETCPHFKARTPFTPTLSGQSSIQLHSSLPGNCHIIYNLGPNSQQACCPTCLERRKDCVFEWYGTELSFSDFLVDGNPIDQYTLSARNKKVYSATYKSLAHIDPLSIQGIWSEIVNHKFRLR